MLERGRHGKAAHIKGPFHPCGRRLPVGPWRSLWRINKPLQMQRKDGVCERHVNGRHAALSQRETLYYSEGLFVMILSREGKKGQEGRGLLIYGVTNPTHTHTHKRTSTFTHSESTYHTLLPAGHRFRRERSHPFTHTHSHTHSHMLRRTRKLQESLDVDMEPEQNQSFTF